MMNMHPSIRDTKRKDLCK